MCLESKGMAGFRTSIVTEPSGALLGRRCELKAPLVILRQIEVFEHKGETDSRYSFGLRRFLAQ